MITLIAVATGAFSVLLAWSAYQYGTKGLADVFADSAGLIGVLGGGGLVPLWKWAITGASPDSRARADRCRRLASNIETQLLPVYEDKSGWSDAQYTELSAELRMPEVSLGDAPWVRMLSGSDTRLRHKRSVTRAITRMRNPVVILEGEPGSGKSVALRHIALLCARRARARGRGPLPVYINLKDFRPRAGEVDSESVRTFVYDTLLAQDSGIRSFLDAEFSDRLKAGSWLLLFDSFDEIPAILAATEADATIRAYAKAIINFTGNNGFRAVIASREFRGPQEFTLPRLCISRLTDRQQRALIRRSRLSPDAVSSSLEAELARPDLRPLFDNPLFLRLSCQYVRDNNVPPDSSYSVFDSYVQHRLAVDSGRARERYGVGTEWIRAYAEQFAFSMASSPDLGLSPATSQLATTISALPTTSPLHADQVPAVLDALDGLGLGRLETDPAEPGITRFTFTHRRLAEYFATCAVFSRPDVVSLRMLLTDGRWRETAVALLQTQPDEVTGPLLAALQDMLAELVGEALGETESFTWPAGLLHLLDVLAAGLGRTPDRIPGSIRELAGQVLTYAWAVGLQYDRVWVIEVARVAPADVTDWLLTCAFKTSSSLLQETALEQAAWLSQLTPAAEAGLRRLLVALWASGELAKRRQSITAQLHRFRQAPELLQRVRLLRWVMPIDVVALCLLGGYTLTAFPRDRWSIVILATLAVAHLSLRLNRIEVAPAFVFRRRASVGSKDTPAVQWPDTNYLRRMMYGYPLRVLPLLAVVLDSNRSGHTGVSHWLDLIVIYYLTAWAEAAVSQVLVGRRISVWTWPLLPVSRYLRTLGFFVRACRKPSLQQWGQILRCLVLLISLIAVDLSALAGLAELLHVSLKFSSPHMRSSSSQPDALLIVIGLVAILVALFGTFLLVITMVTGLRLWARNRNVIDAARRRSAPYSAREMAAILASLRTSEAVRQLVMTLRATRELCPPEVIALFADLLRADEYYDRPAGTRRGRRALSKQRRVLAAPPGSGPDFSAWAAGSPEQLDGLLRALDTGTVDEIIRLVAARV